MSAKNSAAAKSDITSISIDVDKEGDEEELEPEPPRIIDVPKWIEPQSDEEDDDSNFSLEQSWETLLSLPTSQHVIIRGDIQEKLQIVAGVHLTQECSWKQIPFKLLRQYLFDEITNGQAIPPLFPNYDAETPILIGYAPHLVEDAEEKPDGDSYVYVLGAEDTKLAFTIARNIEAYESWHLKRRIYRRPRRWESLGSEHEVNLTLPNRTAEPLDVEIQAVYPLSRRPVKGLQLRLSGDVRDGYTELVPNAEYDNVVRRRITLGIQSAPECRSIEQQTDPTFPTNAWAQYLYEITDDLEMDESDKEPEPEPEKNATDQLRLGLKPPTPSDGASVEEREKTPKPPPEVSDQIKLLLNVLEFNQVDLYRNDYELISPERIKHCFTPHLEESIAYMKLEKCGRRFVSSIDWYSSELVVAAYADNIIATKMDTRSKPRVVNESVLKKHPVLMWSTLDNLDYKLEFETSHAVTFLSFCPYNKSILLGGLSNGQIIVWDLKIYIEKLNDEELLNIDQIKYRYLIGKYTQQQLSIDTDHIVGIANCTPNQISHVAPVTNIRWLDPGYSVDKYGKFDYNQRSEMACFMSTSIDGTIKFWPISVKLDSDYSVPERRATLPELIAQVESPIRRQKLQPIFTLTFNEPLTGFRFDTKFFKALSEPGEATSHDLLSDLDEEAAAKQSLIVVSFYGHVQRLYWQALEPDSESFEVKVRKDLYARCHDGPIMALKQHPFLEDLFVTLSSKTFAVWREEYEYSAIIWRVRNCALTGVSWSRERPSVLYLIRADGNLELWDLLARDDEPCLTQLLDCSGLTYISEKSPSQPEKLLSIGDESTTLRLIKLPKSYSQPMTNELEHFRNYISREEGRKKGVQAWEQKYYERNREYIDAKMMAAAAVRKEIERLEKEMELRRRFTKHEEEVREPSLSHLRYTARMKHLWDEENLKRILNILTTRRRIDADRLEVETRLEKERLRYEAAKRSSLKATFKNVGDSIATIRARILPKETHEVSRADLVADMVKDILKTSEDYTSVQKQCQQHIDQCAAPAFDYYDCLRKGNQRRRTMNVAMSDGIHRQYWYDEVRRNNEMQVCDWGYETFLNACIEESAKEPKQKAFEYNGNSAPINMQDGMTLNLAQH